MTETQNVPRSLLSDPEEADPLISDRAAWPSQHQETTTEVDIENHDQFDSTSQVPRNVKFVTIFSLLCSVLSITGLLVVYILIKVVRIHYVYELEDKAVLLGVLLIFQSVMTGIIINRILKSPNTAFSSIPLAFSYMVDVPLNVFIFITAGQLIAFASYSTYSGGYGRLGCWQQGIMSLCISCAVIAIVAGIANLVTLIIRSIAAYQRQKWATTVRNSSSLAVEIGEFGMEFSVKFSRRERGVQL